MDMLGFRNAIMENDNGIEKRNVLTLNFDVSEQIIRDMFYGENVNVNFLWMSDSFMLSTDISHINELLEYMFEIQRNMLISSLPVRGAICIGRLHHENNIWGEALVRAVELEETQSKYPRIIISNDDYNVLQIKQEYLPYFKTDSALPDYKYLEPISYQLDKCLKNAFMNENGIWAVLNILLETIEEQCQKNSCNEGVYAKWKWLANEYKKVILQKEQIIYEALKIDYNAGMKPQSVKDCIQRLDKIIRS